VCSLVAKAFELSNIEEDEMVALSGISLANAVFENIKGVGPQILPGILDLYLQELQNVGTTDLKVMLLQGFMMAIWYDCNATLCHLELRQATKYVLE
jgi:hypothetical protein